MGIAMRHTLRRLVCLGYNHHGLRGLLPNVAGGAESLLGKGGASLACNISATAPCGRGYNLSPLHTAGFTCDTPKMSKIQWAVIDVIDRSYSQFGSWMMS